MAEHWLQVHDMFREQAKSIERAMQQFRVGSLPAPDFVRHGGAEVLSLVRVLDMHHHAETSYAFPAVAQAAADVAKAFDVLDRDHVVIEGMIQKVRTTLAAPRVDSPRLANELESVLDPLLPALQRHLRDEEDIIVPALIVCGHLVRGF